MKLDKVEGDAHPFWGLAKDGKINEYGDAPELYPTKQAAEAARGPSMGPNDWQPVKVYLVVESE